MSLQNLFAWNTTQEEHRALYPCDAYVTQPNLRVTRAINMNASAQMAYKWVCQLKVAPYSYDWLDNKGRQSPTYLGEGIDKLAKDQSFMYLFEIEEFEHGKHITCTVKRKWQVLAGRQAITYSIKSLDATHSRLIVCIALPKVTLLDKFRASFSGLVFAMGDLIMMRKQLKTLRKYAERDQSVYGDNLYQQDLN